MQLMPARAAVLGVTDAFDPRANLDGGVRHLRELLLRYDGNVRLALAAYNAGEDAVRQHGGVPPFPETQEYVRKVMALYAPTAPDPTTPVKAHPPGPPRNPAQASVSSSTRPWTAPGSRPSRWQRVGIRSTVRPPSMVAPARTPAPATTIGIRCSCLEPWERSPVSSRRAGPSSQTPSAVSRAAQQMRSPTRSGGRRSRP